MSKFITILLAVCFIAATAVDAQSIHPLLAVHKSGAGGPFAVSGVEEEICGEGTIVDVRLAGCTTTPCTLAVGGSYTLEVDFRSLRHHWIMIVRSVILKLGPNPERHVIAADQTIPDSILEEGQLYTFTFPVAIPAGFTGASELRLKLYENFDYQHELCLVIPLTLV